MPSNFAHRASNLLHHALLTLTGNRLGTTMGGMRVLTLTTTGRKSGQPRTAIVNAVLQHGDATVLVASRAGDVRHPDWYLNLRANPDVQVTFPGGQPQQMHARVATADERAELWPQVTATWNGYAKYQSRTDREIPLVLVEPVASDG